MDMNDEEHDMLLNTISTGASSSHRKSSPHVPAVMSWERRTRRRVSKGYMDRLVMNYLIIEGYKEAAEDFRRESHVEPAVDLKTIESRMQVRETIMVGDMKGAMQKIQENDPELLKKDKKLFLNLQMQHLVELIRQGATQEALHFAREELAPLGEDEPEYLKQLEEAMTLLVFKDKTSAPLGSLLDLIHRSNRANQANAAILQNLNQSSEPMLPGIIKLLLNSQEELSKFMDGFPSITWFDEHQHLEGEEEGNYNNEEGPSSPAGAASSAD